MTSLQAYLLRGPYIVVKACLLGVVNLMQNSAEWDVYNHKAKQPVEEKAGISVRSQCQDQSED